MPQDSIIAPPTRDTKGPSQMGRPSPQRQSPIKPSPTRQAPTKPSPSRPQIQLNRDKRPSGQKQKPYVPKVTAQLNEPLDQSIYRPNQSMNQSRRYSPSPKANANRSINRSMMSNRSRQSAADIPPEKVVKRHLYQPNEEYRPVKKQVSPSRVPDLYKAPADMPEAKPVEKLEEVAPEQTGPYRDPLKDYGWKTKRRIDSAYAPNQESKELVERLYPDRYEPTEVVETKASPVRKPTNLEKAMGIVPDDRPKESTAFGIKTYVKDTPTLVHAYDKGLKEKRGLGKTQQGFNQSNLDYLISNGEKKDMDQNNRSRSRDVSKTFQSNLWNSESAGPASGDRDKSLTGKKTFDYGKNSAFILREAVPVVPVKTIDITDRKRSVNKSQPVPRVYKNETSIVNAMRGEEPIPWVAGKTKNRTHIKSDNMNNIFNHALDDKGNRERVVPKNHDENPILLAYKSNEQVDLTPVQIKVPVQQVEEVKPKVDKAPVEQPKSLHKAGLNEPFAYGYQNTDKPVVTKKIEKEPVAQYKPIGLSDHLLTSKNPNWDTAQSPVRQVNFQAKNLVQSEIPTTVEKWNPKSKNLDHLNVSNINEQPIETSKHGAKKKIIEDHFLRRSETEQQQAGGKKKIIESHFLRESHQIEKKKPMYFEDPNLKTRSPVRKSQQEIQIKI